MRKLLSGAAAIALVTVAAQAQQERGDRDDRPAKVERENDKQDRGERPKVRTSRDDNRQTPEERERKAPDQRRGEDRERRDVDERRTNAEREKDGKEADRDERADEARERREIQEREIKERDIQRRATDDRDRARERERQRARERGWEQDRDRDRVRVVSQRGWDNYRAVRFNRGPVDGCPPGLRKKRNGCLPPGHAKRYYETRPDLARYYSPTYFGYDGWGDGRYMYDDGYLFQLDDGWDVASFIPLLGGALSIGNAWPEYYDPAPLPDYYVDYYNLGPASDYRYADDVIYRVNPQSSSITSIAALLTGDQFAIGEPMPAGYDIYNVPYAYRDRYYDTPEANYRYADGYIYQSDPTTGLIQAAIELLL